MSDRPVRRHVLAQSGVEGTVCQIVSAEPFQEVAYSGFTVGRLGDWDSIDRCNTQVLPTDTAGLCSR